MALIAAHFNAGVILVLLFAHLTVVILKGITLPKFVLDVYVCMFYVCDGTGFVD